MPHMIFHCFFTEDISVHFSSIHSKFYVLYVAIGYGFMKFANKSILHIQTRNSNINLNIV